MRGASRPCHEAESMWEQTATSPSTRDVPPLLCSWPSNEGERMCEGTSGNSEMCETSHGGRGGHVNFANPADVTVHAKVLAAGEVRRLEGMTTRLSVPWYVESSCLTADCYIFSPFESF